MIREQGTCRAVEIGFPLEFFHHWQIGAKKFVKRFLEDIVRERRIARSAPNVSPEFGRRLAVKILEGGFIHAL